MLFSQILNVFKLRIGIAIALTALAGFAVTPGAPLSLWQVAVLGLAVLLASSAAGAFNQYVERDLDARMARTRTRPFVTGGLVHDRRWLWWIGAMIVLAVAAAAAALNPLTALHVFLGAFVYAVVYTVWLKRRTWLNIVIGGLAGSFAVFAGAAAAGSALHPAAVILATVLFLWTPSHFWSLAIALHEEYAAAGVPMLPVLVGDRAAARLILGNTVLLVALSAMPVFFGLGGIYLAGAFAGGAFFIIRNIELVRNPAPKTAMRNFHASLIQLTLLLVAALLDAAVRG